VLAELSPTHGLRRRDWGWQLGKLFDKVEDYPTLSGWQGLTAGIVILLIRHKN